MHILLLTLKGGSGMKTVEIDEEVYAYIQSKAIPYEDKTPNYTFRRLFGLDKKAIFAGYTLTAREASQG